MKVGDTLSKISRENYGKPGLFTSIVRANPLVISDPTGFRRPGAEDPDRRLSFAAWPAVEGMLGIVPRPYEVRGHPEAAEQSETETGDPLGGNTFSGRAPFLLTLMDRRAFRNHPAVLINGSLLGPPSLAKGMTERLAPAENSFIHAFRRSLIIRPIAHAGTGSGPGTGWAAVTSRRGFGSHVSEGVRQAGGFAGFWRKCLRSTADCGKPRATTLKRPC